MDRVPAVAGMIDEMNEIIPGVPATEKNLKTLLGELMDHWEAEENFDQTYEVHGDDTYPSCDFELVTHDNDRRELLVNLINSRPLGGRREVVENKFFPLTPDGLLKGIVWAKKSMKRYIAEGPCPDCERPNHKRLKVEGFPSCFKCTIHKAFNIPFGNGSSRSLRRR